MDILYLLIPISVVLVSLIALVLLWAVKHGQFEDMEGPAYRILLDDDSPVIPTSKPETSSPESVSQFDKKIQK
jgi:cbb3-type cytochrome oxidase maturation protein